MRHAPEQAVGPAEAEAARRRSQVARQPAHGRLLDLQRGAGNRAVARLVAKTRKLARVEVQEVRAACDVDAQFAKNYGPWLDAKRNDTGLAEPELLQHFTLVRLKEVVAQSATHRDNARLLEAQEKRHKQTREQAVSDRAKERGSTWYGNFVGGIEDFFEPDAPLLDATGEIKAELGLLELSETLQKFAPSLGKLGAIVNNLQVVAPAEFDTKFVAATKQRGFDAADALATVDYTNGFTLSGVVCLRYGSGANFLSIHTAVHETIHALAHVMAPMIFGQNLNEGMTETITRIVIGEVGPQSKNTEFWSNGDSYAKQRGMIEQLLQHPDVKPTGLNGLLRLYFSTTDAEAKLTQAVQSVRDSGTTVKTPVIQ